MTEHMFILRPPSLLPDFWSPWKCICGVGGTGYDDAAAERQWGLHAKGLWPCWIDYLPGTHPYILDNGDCVWVRDE